MATAWHMEADIQPNSFGDWAKIEGDRSELKAWQLSLLRQWDSKRGSSEIMDVIKLMIPEFKRIHKVLCEKTSIREDSAWVEEVFRKVM